MRGFGAWAGTGLREAAAAHREAFDRDFERRQESWSKRGTFVGVSDDARTARLGRDESA